MFGRAVEYWQSRVVSARALSQVDITCQLVRHWENSNLLSQMEMWRCGDGFSRGTDDYPMVMGAVIAGPRMLRWCVRRFSMAIVNSHHCALAGRRL